MRSSLEGANCADLPAFVVDKYFDCNTRLEPFRAKVAKAICENCVVLVDCVDQTLVMPRLPARGIIAGMSIPEIERARSWLSYEHGIRDRVPPFDRPEWLPLSEASNTVEQWRTEQDPDEPRPQM
ncbi:MAG: hypothetical protein JWP74_511 [Marmoricola sp.]|nr:hypothetical protein [Marmoricola sp.]